MADLYSMASMIAQRTQHELQHQRITHTLADKGTFVHPDAFDLRCPSNDEQARLPTGAVSSTQEPQEALKL